MTEDERQQWRETLFQQANIPKQYQESSFENFLINSSISQNATIHAKVFAEQFAKSYPAVSTLGLLFMGPGGIGKTHLSTAILNFLMKEKCVSCVFCDLFLLHRYFTPSFTFHAVQPILDAEVLLLDGVLSNSIKELRTWLIDVFTYIIHYRYNHRLSTLITTHLYDGGYNDGIESSEQITTYLDDQTLSRIYEMCDIIRFSKDHLDYRRILYTHNNRRMLLCCESPIEEIFFEYSKKRIANLLPQYHIKNYRVDFAIPDKQIAIEIDGHDSHKTKEQRTHDAQRERDLQELGWHVIRFTGSEFYQKPIDCLSQLLKIIDRIDLNSKNEIINVSLTDKADVF